MARRLADMLADRCDDDIILVDAGGDLASARGDHIVAVERPGVSLPNRPGLPTGEAAVRIAVGEGEGVATSGCGRRRWVNGDGQIAHHLIDPAAGRPGPRTQATVIAGDVVTADVLAKTLALRPRLIGVAAENGDDHGRRPHPHHAGVGSAGAAVIAWETARASAFVAFGCYTLVVAWGVLLAGRAWRPAAPQLAFHRFLSSLGLIAVVLHVSAVLLDRLRPGSADLASWEWACARP